MIKTKTQLKKITSKMIETQEKQILVSFNSDIRNEITRLTEIHGIKTCVLEEFVNFVFKKYNLKELIAKPIRVKPLTMAQIKMAIYQHFSIKNTAELKNSGVFRMAISGIDTPNLAVKENWEKLYRKFIGILPGEENESGYGCINGINVFKYFKPWQVFDLDCQIATTQDIKNAYRRLSKIYHPDVSETGDAAIFAHLTIMYKSINAEA